MIKVVEKNSFHIIAFLLNRLAWKMMFLYTILKRGNILVLTSRETNPLVPRGLSPASVNS